MSKIHDPNVDRLFGGQPPPPQQAVLATPLNDIQLIGLMATHLASQKPKPEQAVGFAIELLAEAIVQMKGGALDHAVRQIATRHQLNGAAGNQ